MMFANTLVECAPHPQSRRNWALITSLLVQLAGLSLALVYPLFHPERIPILFSVPKISISAPAVVRLVSSVDPPERAPSTTRLQLPQLNVHQFNSSLPRTNTALVNQSGEPQPTVALNGLTSGPVIPGNILNTKGADVARAGPPSSSKPLRFSHLDPGALIRKIQPAYPLPAKLAGIQGEVLLTALIAEDGSIEGLKAISGHPQLIPAAIQAVSQWRYRPYILNGAPTKVETTIKVEFKLDGR